MVENGNGHVPTRIVELLITNINELSKHVQHMPPMVSKELAPQIDKLEDSCNKIITKLNTPPRNEELKDSLTSIDDKVSQHNMDVDNKLIKKISNMTLTVKVAMAVLSIAILLSGAFVSWSQRGIDNEQEIYIKKQIEQIRSENKAQIEEIKRMIREKHPSNN